MRSLIHMDPYTPTPRSAAPVRMPRPWFAIKLIARQLIIKPENLRHVCEFALRERRSMAYLKNAMRERERSSPGDREEAKMERKTAGVTGMRLVLRRLVGVPSSAPVPVVLPFALTWAEEAESGYGRREPTGGGVEMVVVVVPVAAYVVGVTVLVLDVEPVGVRLELELESTEGEGEGAIGIDRTNDG